jgi:hypothetical protein
MPRCVRVCVSRPRHSVLLGRANGHDGPAAHRQAAVPHGALPSPVPVPLTPPSLSLSLSLSLLYLSLSLSVFSIPPRLRTYSLTPASSHSLMSLSRALPCASSRVVVNRSTCTLSSATSTARRCPRHRATSSTRWRYVDGVPMVFRWCSEGVPVSDSGKRITRRCCLPPSGHQRCRPGDDALQGAVR